MDLTNPRDQSVLGQTSIGVFDLDKGELNSSFAEILD